MTEQPEAQVARGDGAKRQWGKNLLYRVQGKKGVLKMTAVVVLAVCSTVLMLILSILFDSGDNQLIGKSIVKLRDDLIAEKIINLPFHSEETDQQKSREGAQSGGVGKQTRKFSGLALIKREANLTIPPGVIVPGRLIGAASNGLVRAELTDSLRVNGETLLPSGVILVGEGNSTESRLFISFKQAVFRDGLFTKIDAQACDPDDKMLGLSGSRLGYEGLKLAAGIGLNFAAGLSQGLQDRQGINGGEITPPTPKNALLNGASVAALEQSKDLMSDVKSKQPQIVSDSGKEVCVIFSGTQ